MLWRLNQSQKTTHSKIPSKWSLWTKQSLNPNKHDNRSFYESGHAGCTQPLYFSFVLSVLISVHMCMVEGVLPYGLTCEGRKTASGFPFISFETGFDLLFTVAYIRLAGPQASRELSYWCFLSTNKVWLDYSCDTKSILSLVLGMNSVWDLTLMQQILYPLNSPPTLALWFLLLPFYTSIIKIKSTLIDGGPK